MADAIWTLLSAVALDLLAGEPQKLLHPVPGSSGIWLDVGTYGPRAGRLCRCSIPVEKSASPKNGKFATCSLVG